MQCTAKSSSRSERQISINNSLTCMRAFLQARLRSLYT
nr:MAG TPA: hypothetical protein [Caudoviricetes sp.]